MESEQRLLLQGMERRSCHHNSGSTIVGVAVYFPTCRALHCPENSAEAQNLSTWSYVGYVGGAHVDGNIVELSVQVSASPYRPRRLRLMSYDIIYILSYVRSSLSLVVVYKKRTTIETGSYFTLRLSSSKKGSIGLL